MRERNWFVGAVAWALVAGMSAAAAGQAAKKSVEVSDTPAVHGFSVALVLGDMQGTSTPDNLSAGARKALSDLREFLPFKSYRLLDTQWMLCCGGARGTHSGLAGRLRGLDEQQYSFDIDVASTGSKLALHFSLREEQLLKKLTENKSADADAVSQMTKDSEKAKKQQRDVLEAMLVEERKSKTPDHVVVRNLEVQLEKLKRESDDKARAMTSAKGAVIDSTFSMDVGETVVIGTSSLKGDKALIAVLTAVKRPQSQSSTLGEKR
jgi:hypothetical protein